MKIERRHVLEQAKPVEIVECRERRDLVRARDQRGAQPIGIVHGNAEPLHQRARVLTEALLPRHQRVAVMDGIPSDAASNRW